MVVIDLFNLFSRYSDVFGVGFILVEATAVTEQGRMTPQDLGIWNNSHVKGLKELTKQVHDLGTPIGIQLSHAGRKANIDGSIIAPSAIPNGEGHKLPEEMSINQIKEVIKGLRVPASMSLNYMQHTGI